MYDKLNITETHLRVLSLFTKGFNREYYIREVHKLLKISPRTAQLILDNLEKKTVLESQTKGKIRTYKIRKSITSLQYLVLTEHYRTLVFMEKHPVVREIISKIRPGVSGVGLIFGSYAKGLETSESDLDVFVVGDECDRKGIRNVSKLYGIEINVKNYPVKLFEENLRSDILIKEVLEDHIVFSNAESLVNMVLLKANG